MWQLMLTSHDIRLPHLHPVENSTAQKLLQVLRKFCIGILIYCALETESFEDREKERIEYFIHMTQTQILMYHNPKKERSAADFI